MTANELTTPATDRPKALHKPRPWRDVAVDFATDLARSSFPRGDLAALRRMDPDNPNAAAFWRLMAFHNLPYTWENQWALILHGIALMTPAARGEGKDRSAHDGCMSVGKALFLGGEASRLQAFYSEIRLNRLLTAREKMLRILLARMFRMLATANVSFNWGEMASFILNEGYDDRAEQSRRRIAREYYKAERQHSTIATT